MEKDARIEVTPFWAYMSLYEALSKGITIEEVNHMLTLRAKDKSNSSFVVILEYYKEEEKVLFKRNNIHYLEDARSYKIDVLVVLYDQVKPITMYQSKIEFKDGE